jgi:hypothetical protein
VAYHDEDDDRLPEPREDDAGIGEEERKEHRYQFDRFIVPASDHRGHSVERLLRIQPGLDRQLQVIVQSQKFPYRTWQEAARHGILRHVRYCRQIEPELPMHWVAGVEASDEVIRDDEFRSLTEEVFIKLEARVHEHLERGDLREVQRLLSLIFFKIDKVADCAWKRRFQARFSQQYKGYL